MSILRALYQDDNIAFWHPVPEGVDGYMEVIKEPMDLSSVTKRLKAGRIQEAMIFKAKVDLVWDNCMTFNDVGSQIHEVAKAQKARVAKMYHAVFVSDDKPIDPDVLFEDDGSIKDITTGVAAKAQQAAPASEGQGVEVKAEEDVKMEVETDDGTGA